MVQLNSKDWELEVELEGGRIVSLKNRGVLILGSFERIDGKKGNTHICVPNFNMEGVKEFNLPPHGPFRNESWKLVQQTENLIDIECEKDGLDVHQFFSFNGEEYFNQKVVVENKGEVEKPVNVAIQLI